MTAAAGRLAFAPLPATEEEFLGELAAPDWGDVTKSGVVLDTEIDVVSEAYEFYLVNYEYDPMARVRDGQLSKLAPGPAPRTGAERLVSHFTANHTTDALRFTEPQPQAAGHRGRVHVVADVLEPPLVAGDDWRVVRGHGGSPLRSPIPRSPPR